MNVKYLIYVGIHKLAAMVDLIVFCTSYWRTYIII